MKQELENYRSWKGWTDGNFGALQLRDKVYFDAEFSDSSVALAGATVFELGFGNGNFLAYCRENGAEAVGMEIDPDLVSRAKAAGFEAHVFSDTAIDDLEENRFDVIVAFDVFEHIQFDQLQALLGRLKNILRPGGIVLARFPSGDSPFSGAMYNGDATHRCLLGSGKLKQLAIASGFNLVEMRGARLPIKGLGIKTMVKRAGIVVVRRIVEAILRPVYYNNGRQVIAANAVCVLRKPKI